MAIITFSLVDLMSESTANWNVVQAYTSVVLRTKEAERVRKGQVPPRQVGRATQHATAEITAVADEDTANRSNIDGNFATISATSVGKDDNNKHQ